MKKVVICAVPYSDNLGDGIIAGSLSYLIKLKYPDARIEYLDIAGREEFELDNARGGGKFKLFQVLPLFVRSIIVAFFFTIKFLFSWKVRWSKRIQDADLLVIGGGQLFCDVALNFPLKLFLLGRVVRDQKVILTCVGVAKKWSHFGTLLVKSFLKRVSPKKIAVRDDDSKVNLAAIFGINSSNISVIHDPALIVDKAFVDCVASNKSWCVGICISNLDALAMNSEYGAKNEVPEEQFFREVFLSLGLSPSSVILFTNGASEDNKTAINVKADQVFEEVGLIAPKTPGELVSVISGCDLIIAHRLHANIISYSLGVPSIGLNWDKKVNSFFHITGREEFLVALDSKPRVIAEMALGLLANPVSSKVDPNQLKLDMVKRLHSII